MAGDKAPGPDGFPPPFFKRYGSFIKFNIMPVFDEFRSNPELVSRINCANTILIPNLRVPPLYWIIILLTLKYHSKAYH